MRTFLVIATLLAALLSTMAQEAAWPASPSTRQLKKESARIQKKLADLPSWTQSSQQHGRIGFHGIATSPAFIIIDFGAEVDPDEVVLFPARVPSANEQDLSGFPPEIEVEISDDPEFAGFHRIGRWEESGIGEGMKVTMLRFPAENASGRYLRLRIFGSRVRPSGRGRYFSLGEIVVLDQGRNVALGRNVSHSRSIENAPRWEARNLTDGLLWCLPFAGTRPSSTNGFHSGIETETTKTSKWVEIDLEKDHTIDEIRLYPAHPQDFADTAGFGFPPSYSLRAIRADGTSAILHESTEASFANPGSAPIMIPIPGMTARRVRFETSVLWRRTQDYLFALAEMQILAHGENLAHDKPVSASDAVETGLWGNETLTDGYTSRHHLLSWTEWLDGVSEREALETRKAELANALAIRSAQAKRRWVIGSLGTALAIAALAWFVLLRQRSQAVLEQDRLRRRIAADLHDELGASLSHLALQGELTASKIDDDEARSRLSRLSETARNTLDDMRDVIWLLDQGPENWSEFVTRLENIMDRLLEATNHEFRTEGTPPAGRPPIEWAREVVCSFKEALSNARRHGRAENITVTLVWTKSFNLLIEDDGTGFDSCPVPDGSHSSGMGLRNLRQRAESLGGTATICSEPDRGTSVSLKLPLPDLPT